MEENANFCDIFPVQLSEFMPNLLSSSFLGSWNNLGHKLGLPEFDLIDFNLSFRFMFPNFIPNLASLLFAVPSVGCWCLVLVGFFSSFGKRARIYLSSQEVLEWLSKVSLYMIFVVINMMLSAIKMMQGTNVPVFNLTVNIGSGFVLWVAAQLLTLVGKFRT